MKKLMVTFLLLTGFILPTRLFAGIVNEEWVVRYDGPANSSNYVRDMAVDSSGNVYVTGTSHNSSWDCDYVTIKYDRNGNEEWVTRYNGPANGYDDARAIAVDNSGNVYVTGYSNVVSGIDYDYTTIKYDTNGNQLWVARYTGPANSYSGDYATAIAVDSSGNVYVTGYSYGSNAMDVDYATVKYGPNGQELWARRYAGPANSLDDAHAIAVDNSGNVYVTGWSNVGGSSDYLTVKYDTNGDEEWVVRYNGPANGYNDTRAIAVDSSGNVYVTGYSCDTTVNAAYATVKYDPNGNQLWVARYNGPESFFDCATKIAVDSSGNVYVTGYSHGSWEDSVYATVKYDPNGNQLWVARYEGPGSFYNFATDIAVDSSGNVYVTGAEYSYDTSGAESVNYATVKYDTNGDQLWVARYNGSSAYPYNEAIAMAIDNSGNVYVTGYSYGDYNLDCDYATVKYSQTVVVAIDIKPGSDPNSIKLSSAGVIPVAILSSKTFNAVTVDPATVSLAGARVKLVGKSDKYLSHEEDVNGDGLLDLLCQVNTAQFMIEPGDSSAVLEANTFDGTSIRGEDSVRIVPD